MAAGNISSRIKTAIQAAADTLMRLPPFHATIIAVMNPARAEIRFWVADRMAGNVMTDSVT